MRRVTRITTFLTTLVGLLIPPALTFAQDPVATLPDAYRLQFENEWVKVVRVHYAAGAKLPEHSHPAASLAFVYLIDAEPVVFKHSGSNNRNVTRPAVKAGSYRLARGDSETHAVDNESTRSSEFLRVQFKTDPAGVRAFRRRVPAPSSDARGTGSEVEFSNAQIRISRITIAPGDSVDLTTGDAEPALLVALSDARLTVARASSSDLSLSVGQDHWLETRQREHVTNAGSAPVVLLRFDFLTSPSQH
jgi:hypothetical protein